MLDAVECPPTFNSAPGQVVALLAGGDGAFVGAAERAEDDVQTAPAQLAALGIGADDAVVGIAASGRTPYVLAGMAYARSVGALTVGLSCNPHSQLSDVVDHPIEVVVGPEFIAGSTRLKAGTAQKLVLNMISTITMVRLGKTLGNLMVDLQATNEKLHARAIRIIAQASGVDESAAAAALAAADGDTRIAIVALGRGVDSAEARRQLEASGGDLRRALGAHVRVTGLISGTSFDAIEAAAVDFELAGDVLEARLVATSSTAYEPGLRGRIAAALPPAETTLAEVCAIDTLIGQAFAGVAAALELDSPSELVCSHGQTVFHWVEGTRALGTLQLGQPAWIAERIGVPVVSDVRIRDIAAGGQGAPLASVLDVLLLGDSDRACGGAQPRRYRQHHRHSARGGADRVRHRARERAHRSSRWRVTEAPRRTTSTERAPAAGASTRRCSNACSSEPYYAARAAEVDGQGALPRPVPRGRRVAARRPARDARRAHGGDRRA